MGVIESEFEGEQIFLVFDEWVEIKVQIDFDADLQSIYYDGSLLSEKSWTEGVSGGGALNLEAVDLFANGASPVYYDDFVLEGPEPVGPDLDCEGDLEWVDVEPGSTVTGEFTVSNIGAAGTGLNWEVESSPSWATFTYDPESGEGLTPEDSPVTVAVEVVAPEEQETEFEGEIKVVNSDDPDDFCVIPVSLITPVSQEQSQLQTIKLLQSFF
jgi:hypothetical protein